MILTWRGAGEEKVMDALNKYKTVYRMGARAFRSSWWSAITTRCRARQARLFLDVSECRPCESFAYFPILFLASERWSRVLPVLTQSPYFGTIKLTVM